MFEKSDEIYIGEALKEAQKAFNRKEVPVGAVIVYEGRIIARASNQTDTLKDATAHAEMIAITQASASLGDWRLVGATLYVTKEPCPMCAGAIINSRISRLVFGVSDPEMGAAGGMINIVSDKRLRQQAEITRGVREEECRQILQEFFVKLRSNGR